MLGSKAILGMILITFSAMCYGEMPKEIKGSWIVDAEATEKNLATSPQWTATDAKYLPSVMKRMSQVSYLFEEDMITASMRKEKHPLNVTLTKGETNIFVFEGNDEGKPVVITVTITNEGLLNIKPSSNNDMDYYLWKRGTPGQSIKSDDQQLAIDIIKASLETPPVEAQTLNASQTNTWAVNTWHDLNTEITQEGTPEHVAVAYMRALHAGDADAAINLCDEEYAKKLNSMDRKYFLKRLEKAKQWDLEKLFRGSKSGTDDVVVISFKYFDNRGNREVNTPYKIILVDGKYRVTK